MAGVRLDRWTEKDEGDIPWLDVLGQSPVTVYRKYLTERRAWELQAWRIGGSNDPRFAQLLDKLVALHAEVSTAAPPERRDVSIVKPPTRDPSKVTVEDVDWNGADSAVIRTSEEEFPGLLPTTFTVSAIRQDGRWRFDRRQADHGAGRLLDLL